ncbi:hypothetical protein GCM10011374_36780 [Kocuria dechangensis]|uniref:HTH araC/xylS-type domain-containing protein n=1 Tax=Kocuria dechangensis TaxID=1176249 RepID=A0A917H6D0_9MICC|nr:AraC family transcriptional regulator [Kocuria dechangensis]GGG68989.1 hypothetical protein GCM10011374_36780 [Kocuria dechangensis]
MLDTLQRCSVATRDPQEGLDALTQVYPGLRIDGDPEGSFALELTSVTAGPLRAHRYSLRGLSWPASADVSGSVAISYLLSGQVTLDIDGASSATQGPFLHPQGRHSGAWGEVEQLTVALDLPYVEDYARHLVGNEDLRLEFTGSTPVSQAGLQHWVGTLAHLYREVLLDDEAMNVPLIRHETIRTLTTALLRCFPNNSLAHPHPPEGVSMVAARIRRAKAFIDAHLDTDIGLVDIAAAARMSPHRMLAAFRRELDTTPREYLRAARLNTARHGSLPRFPGHARPHALV